MADLQSSPTFQAARVVAETTWTKTNWRRKVSKSQYWYVVCSSVFENIISENECIYIYTIY